MHAFKSCWVWLYATRSYWSGSGIMCPAPCDNALGTATVIVRNVNTRSYLENFIIEELGSN